MSSTKLDLISDAILLVQVQQGSKEAFNCLYQRYWDQAYSNAYRRVRDADQAKDIVQEIFVKIWLKKETVIDSFPAYLNIAVRNQVFKLAKKQKVLSPFFDLLNQIPARHQEADSNICFKEFYRSYEALLSTLPPKRQLIFRLRFQEDRTTKEIANHMGISRKTVQNQLGKAIELLRVVLLPCLVLLLCNSF